MLVLEGPLRLFRHEELCAGRMYTKSGLIGPSFRTLPAIVGGTAVPPTSGANSIIPMENTYGSVTQNILHLLILVTLIDRAQSS